MTSNEKGVDLQQLFPQAALDAVPQPMWIYGRDGVAAGCNITAEKFWRLPREHIVGKYNAFEHAETPDGASLRELVRAVRAALDAGSVEVCEPVLIDLGALDVTTQASKERAYIENTIFPLRDRDGAIHFAAVLQRNVTELVEKRQEVEQATARIAAQSELIAALEAAQHALVEQRQTIEELSTPIIEVSQGVLALPILGSVDEARAGEMMHKLLEQIAHSKAQFAILDLTGVQSVDIATAEHLARIMKAAGLLGALGILSGVSPAVADALTSIEVDMTRFITCRNLSDALTYTKRSRRPGPAGAPIPGRR
ncbi:STAS domain-containing protein [Nannocystis exedens]|nr:STAS domain-containing protein [Nannocystis exedens]